MKRIVLSFAVVVVVCLGVAGNAAAWFEPNSLTLSVWNRTTNIETGYDLGTITPAFLAQQNVTLLSGANFSDTAAFAAIYSTANTGAPGSSYGHYWAIARDTNPGFSMSQILNFTSGVSTVWQNYGINATGPQVQIAASSFVSASTRIGQAGDYAGILTGLSTPADQPRLAALATDAYVDYYLYAYPDALNLDKGFDSTTDYAAVIRLTQNGSVILNPPRNQPPVISSATASPSPAAPGATVTLSAAASDPEGGSLTYTWSTNAPGLTGFPKQGAQVSFTVPTGTAGQVYPFTVTVSDGALSASDAVLLSIVAGGGTNHPPVIASATADPNPAAPGATVTLSAAASDPDGDNLTYTWSATAGALTGFPRTGAQVSFSVPAGAAPETSYPITLTVSDGQASATRNLTVSVASSGGTNQPPVISSATADPNPAAPGATVTLSAAASDPDQDPLTYTWSTTVGALSGFPRTGAHISFSVPADAAAETSYPITLTVSDGQDSDTRSLTVTVAAPAPETPRANAGGAQSVAPGALVTLDGSGSQNPDGLISAWLWEQTGGVAVVIEDAEQAVARFTAPDPITELTRLTFRLTVFWDEGAQSHANSCIVDVEPFEYVAPVADAGDDRTVYENAQVTLDGRDSTVNPTTTIEWHQESGPTVAVSAATTLLPKFQAPEIQTTSAVMVFRLELSEAGSVVASDTVRITVKKDLPPSAPSSALTPVGPRGGKDNVWVADAYRPTLYVNNAEDPEGDALTYDFQLFDAPDPLPENLVFQVIEVPEGNNLTGWTTPMLTENTFYYFRARAGHILLAGNGDRQTGPWMDIVPIFVNVVQEPPGVPEISAPATGGSVDTFTPRLEVGNTTDPDLDALTYEFRVFFNATDPVHEPFLFADAVVEGTEGTTSWVVDTPLEEDTTYWWRARAVDETGLAGEWTDPAVFLVNTSNHAPSVPVVTFPADQARIQTAEPLFEITDAVDPEGDPVFIHIELDTVNTFNSPALIKSGALEVTGPVTTWQVPVTLEENGTYFYRVKATDEVADSAWVNGSFFVNQYNEPPDTPRNLLPEDREIVTTLSPTLIATAATDPDRDAVTYQFELFLAGNLTDPLAVIADLEQPRWVVPGYYMANGKKYYWHARAVDELGVPGQWSELTEFTTGANYYQPSMPERVNPFDGGTVGNLTPTLTVVAREDGDGNEIWIEFELYRDHQLSDFVSFAMVPRGTTATSWQVDVTLEDQREYFWRVRATDGEKYSAWTSIGRFTVELQGGGGISVQVWKTGNYDPTVPWYTVIAVDNPESPIFGVRVVLPPGALSAHETLFIGQALGAPGFNGGQVPVGKVVMFGPSGTVFNIPVTIKIPYTEQDLEQAGGVPPEDLQVFWYDETAQSWSQIPVDAVDRQEQMLICLVEHFSLYAKALPAGNGTPPPQGGEGGGGGGGGCFIAAAASHPGPDGAARLVFLALAGLAVFVGRTAFLKVVPGGFSKLTKN